MKDKIKHKKKTSKKKEVSILPNQKSTEIAVRESESLSRTNDNQSMRIVKPSGTDEFLPLNEEEKSMIENWRREKESAESHICFTALPSGKDVFSISMKNSENRGNEKEKRELSQALICRSTGAKDASFGIKIFTSCLASTGLIDESKKDQFADHSNAIINAMSSLKPQDEFEGMLISQALGLHFQGMNYLGLAATKEATPEGRNNNINRAMRLLRVQHETLEALTRYRRKGEQKVVVQHVNVNEGGQAIVGNVVNRGGGRQHKSGEVPPC